MGLTRRSFGGVFAGASTMLPSAKAEIERGLANITSSQKMNPFPPNTGPFTEQAPNQVTRIMDHDKAQKLAKLFFKDQLREQAWINNRRVQSLDDDLIIKKSWSTMAKITFQRERNVEHDVMEFMKDQNNSFGNKFHAYLNKLMFGG